MISVTSRSSKIGLQENLLTKQLCKAFIAHLVKILFLKIKLFYSIYYRAKKRVYYDYHLQFWGRFSSVEGTFGLVP